MRTWNDFKNEDPKIVRCYDSISTTFVHACRGFCFLEAFDASGDQKTERGVLQFIKASAQFFMVIQLTKLYEEKITGIKGDASLIKLNTLLSRQHSDYLDVYKSNKRLIKEILGSDLYEHMLKLRNRCYAHADDDPINPIFKFEFLSTEEIKKTKDLILTTEKVLKHTMSFYDTDIIFHNWYNNPSPANFLEKILPHWRPTLKS